MTQVGVSVEIALQVQMLEESVISATQQLIEDVEVSLVGILMNDARLL